MFQRFSIYFFRGHYYLAVSKTLAYRIAENPVTKVPSIEPTLIRFSAQALKSLPAPTTDKYTASLVLEFPEREKHSALKKNLKLCREYWINYGMTRDPNYRRLFYSAVCSLFEYYNKDEFRSYNIRDIGRLIGIKSMRSYYEIMTAEILFQTQQREKVISRAGDLTIVTAVNRIRRYWPCIHGFSKKLDVSLKAELKLYVNTMKARSLSINSRQAPVLPVHH